MLSKKKKSRIKECSNGIHKKKCIYNTVGLLSTFSLLLLGCSLLNPAGFGNGISNGTNDSLGSSNKAYAEEGISELTDTGISLTISGDVNEAIQADTKNTAYRAHTVKAIASSIDSYSLSISYTDSSTSLRNSDANVSIGDVASSGVNGNSMQANTWGWGWSDSASTNNSDITYRPMSTSQSIIKSDNSPVNNTANIEGKLAFAAKFPEGSAAGHYTANVLVSFAIEPKAVTTGIWSNGIDSGIHNMQDITSGFCNGNNSITEGVSTTLNDSRNDKTYTVAKLKDGKCWMTQNLALDLNGRTLTTTDSNVSADWPSTTGAPALWSDTTSTIIKYYDGSSTTNYDEEYGYYYSFCAATAGSCPANNTTAPSSICPKSWHLPLSADLSAGIFKDVSYDTEGAITLTSAPYNFVYGGTVYSGQINGLGASATYWPGYGGTSGRDNVFGYGFSSTGSFQPGGGQSSSTSAYLGKPVRCLTNL